MKVSFLFRLGLALFLLGPSIAQAQQRGVRFTAARPSVSVRHGSFGTSPIRTSRRNTFGASNGSFSTGFANLYPGTSVYPGTGLGINGINTILSEPNLGVEAAIDPATQWNLALAQRFPGIGGGGFPGYYLLSGGGAYPAPMESDANDQPLPQQQQPQVIVLQQASPQQPSQAAQNAEAQNSVPSLPDVGQFTLVLKDGKQLQAVAFTQMKGRIIYISSDGTRHTLALGDLNTDETVRVNQERGTPLQLTL